MLKVLIVVNNRQKDKLITKGFASGFRKNGCFVKLLEFKDIKIEDITKFKPDIIFNYNYGIFESLNKGILEYLQGNDKIKIVNYFGDNPQNKTLFKNKKLYEKYKTLSESNRNIYSFIWDKKYLTNIPNAKFVPLAVNYKKYKTEEVPILDISFIGSPIGETRQRLLSIIIKNFGNKLNIFCEENDFLNSIDCLQKSSLLNEEELEIYKKSYKKFLSTENEIASICAYSKVNINITNQEKSATNYHLLEILASRGFVITNETDDIKKNFIIGKELETFTNEDELIDKISFYLKNITIAQKIATIGFAGIVKSYSFTARVKTMLDILKQSANIV